MSIEDLFPTQELSATETDIVAQAFNLPAVKKYLRTLGANDAKELLALSSINNEDSKLAKAHAQVQGKLQVISTLLSIEAPQSSQPQ